MIGAAKRFRTACARAAGRHGIRLHATLGVLAALSIAAALLLSRDFGRQIDSALSETALAGRQEMLVQRIALMAGRLVRDPGPGVHRRSPRAFPPGLPGFSSAPCAGPGSPARA